MRIGEALVERGAITAEQLEAALQEQRKTPETPLGLVLGEMYDLPVETVDLAYVQAVLLPRFRKSIMARLLSLSKGDKFAKGLNVVDFVTAVSTVAEEFEVRVYSSRRYKNQDGVCSRRGDGKGFVTLMDVRVEVKAKTGATIDGLLHVRYDTRTDELVITDDEARIKEALYYGLRTAFRSG